MIQTWWWSRSSDDPDLMVIQRWWSRSSDDDLDRVIIQIQMKMNWRWRWPEDEHDLNMQMTRWSKEEDQGWKLCQENTFLVKRECWWNCNFGIYSLVFLMYCNMMFIPGCICNVLESCHTLMFILRSFYNEKVMSSHCQFKVPTIMGP